MSSAPDPRSDVIQTVHRSAEIALEYGHEYVTLEHLLFSLLDDQLVKKTIVGVGVAIEVLRDAMQAFLDGDFIAQVPNAIPTPSSAFDDVMRSSMAKAYFSPTRIMRPVDLLVSMLEYPTEDSFALTLLMKHGLTKLAIKRYLAHGSGGTPEPVSGIAGTADIGSSVQITNRAEAEACLAKYCVNLNATAADKKIDPLIGRADEVARIIQISARRTKNNTILVGEPGTGKTAIAEGLALKIVRSEVPAAIADAVVYSLDIGALVAGTRYRGDFEERMKQVLTAFGFIDRAILFIDEIHTIMGAGGTSSGSLDAANLLKPALARGTLRCIGATTHDEYRKHFEKDRALLRRFKKVMVSEPSVADAKLILKGLAPTYAAYHGVTYTDAAIEAAVDLTHRYVTNAQLPDKAIDIIDAAGARQRVAPDDRKKTVIDLSEIEDEVSSVAQIPAQTLAEDDRAKYARLDDDLRGKVFDQNEAIETLVGATLIARSGLREPGKPQGSYLFTGPTGVGKTEAAKQLAATLGVPLVRFDMSEYMERHTVSRLIGAPPGYVGHGEGGAGNGLLTNAVDTTPYCVLLLDEVEKAHPDIFNLLLQVMDDGRLTSGSGKTVDFQNVILIMTSNAGAREAATNRIGFGSFENTDGDTAKINDVFSPEFRNRLDAIVRFRRLTKDGIARVVEKFVAALCAQAAERNVTVDVSDDARSWLAEKGYDPLMGARPLARVIAKAIKEPLAPLMLFGALKDGGKALVSRIGDGLEVRVV